MVSFNRQAARALTLSVALAAAGVLVTAGSAHHEPPVLFDAATAVTTPTIDGVVGADEWADTPGHFVLFGELSGTVRFKHGLGYLYGSLTVSDPGLDSKLATFYFDDDHDGSRTRATTPSSSAPRAGPTTSTSAQPEIGPGLYRDVDGGGTEPPSTGGVDDVESDATDASGVVSFEFRHPLCSADTVHDFCVDPGSSLGLQLEYQTGPDNFFNPGANGVDASDWGDLLISADPAATTQIVFETNRDGQLEIYKMNADGSAPTRLTNNPAVDNLPSISPDGTHVAFTSDREGSSDIYVMNIDGSGITRLTSDAGTELQPAWSPDGTKIAYTGSSIEQFDIFVMNADGTGQTNVTSNAAQESNAGWSPDGMQLAFTSSRDGNNEIYRMNADGSGTPTRLTNNSADDHDPDWSPDGQKLAFYSDRVPRSGCCGSVWTINATDGSGATNLSGGPIFDADPAWSPDGTQIAFVRDAAGQNFEVWTADADGTNQVNLTPIGGRNSFPDWGPIASGMSATISIDGPASSTPGRARLRSGASRSTRFAARLEPEALLRSKASRSQASRSKGSRSKASRSKASRSRASASRWRT